MTPVCLYFKVHQPYRLKKHRVQGVELSYCYADVAANRKAISILADDCYLPANEIIYKLIKQHTEKFKISYSISGTTLELFQKYRPDVISSFQQLVSTGCVEIMAETFYHSLSSLHSKQEFRRQVIKHSQLVNELFGIQPSVFRNTELIHNNNIATQVADLGLKGLLCEGVESVLHGRSPNNVYALPGNAEFGLLLRNAGLSDDIAFRFDDTSWNEHPLTAEKFAEWIHIHPRETGVINLMMDYETFGIHKKRDSGIFEFLEALPAAVLANESFIFSSPSEVLANGHPATTYDSPTTISWEDKTNASCVWCDNMMQNNTLHKIYSIENMVLTSDSAKAIDMWGRLQAADYFYYMSAKSCQANAYKYNNPFSTPEDAFQNYSNIVADLEIALIEKEITRRKKTSARAALISAIL